MHFASDNTAGAHPKVLEALAAANEGVAASYGADRWSAELTERLSTLFGREVDVLPVATGGAANALALSALAKPWQAVFCHREAHVQTDECGAPEFFSGGAKLVLLDGPAGKFEAAALERALRDHPRGVVHRVQPGAVTLTQSTECGAVWRAGEIADVARVAKAAALPLHMDGARFANALARTGSSPADMTWKAGVDALSLGFTKTGAIAAEAIILFDRRPTEELGYRRKRSGHLFSKMRFFAAQFLAMLEDDLWLETARAANAAADALADAFREAGIEPEWPVEANAVFARLPKRAADALRAEGAAFYAWGPETGSRPLYRFVCSFATTQAEIDAFGYSLRNHVA